MSTQLYIHVIIEMKKKVEGQSVLKYLSLLVCDPVASDCSLAFASKANNGT